MARTLRKFARITDEDLVDRLIAAAKDEQAFTFLKHDRNSYYYRAMEQRKELQIAILKRMKK